MTSAAARFQLGTPGAADSPQTDLTGLDTSEAMLAHARLPSPSPILSRCDIADWSPGSRPDLIFSNSALHFLPDHHQLIPRLARALAPGGVFAAQMPSNANDSSHALMRMVAAEGPWSSRLVPLAKTQPLIAAHRRLLRMAAAPLVRDRIWMTTYVYTVRQRRRASPTSSPAPPSNLSSNRFGRRALRLHRPLSRRA